MYGLFEGFLRVFCFVLFLEFVLPLAFDLGTVSSKTSKSVHLWGPSLGSGDFEKSKSSF